MKRHIIYLLLFISPSFFPQFNNFVGVGCGYSGIGSITSNGSSYFDLHYILNYRPLLFETRFNIVPNSDFGFCSGGSICIGFTTKMDKLISAHFTYGIGKYWVSEKTFTSKYDQNNQPLPESTYIYSNEAFNPILNFGITFNPFKKHRFVLGIESSVIKIWTKIPAYEEVGNPPFVIYHPVKYVDFMNFSYFISVSYLFKNKKQ